MKPSSDQADLHAAILECSLLRLCRALHDREELDRIPAGDEGKRCERTLHCSDTRTLCLAVKDEEKTSQGSVLSMMSERAASLLLNEVANIGAVSGADVETAKAIFVEALHDAMDDGAAG